MILSVRPLDFVWFTEDPFLFCVHHDDAYPRGNAALGPAESLAGRNLGMDFEPRNGWRMYHGETVPGFPAHPHRGFETVTLARRGYIDHSDSLGAAARFGQGDVQWMTAGDGVVHSEMFPLLKRDEDNPVELFQIWMNLPKASKRVPPHFSMLWSEQIPRARFGPEGGPQTEVTVVAGHLNGLVPPRPPPHSWAGRPDSDVAIWPLRLEPGAQFTLPATLPTSRRTLYLFAGESCRIAGSDHQPSVGLKVSPDRPLPLENRSNTLVELLLLQGRPIGEPVVQHGPFVMNTREEIAQAVQDYRRTRFGGWPWPRPDPHHGAESGRFARHADGRIERRES